MISTSRYYGLQFPAVLYEVLSDMHWAKHITTLSIIPLSLYRISAKKVILSYFAKRILSFDEIKSFKVTHSEIIEQGFRWFNHCVICYSALPFPQGAFLLCIPRHQVEQFLIPMLTLLCISTLLARVQAPTAPSWIISIDSCPGLSPVCPAGRVIFLKCKSDHRFVFPSGYQDRIQNLWLSILVLHDLSFLCRSPMMSRHFLLPCQYLDWCLSLAHTRLTDTCQPEPVYMAYCRCSINAC